MTIVFKVSDNVKEKMIKFYANYMREKKPPYSVFQAQNADVIITLYESGKVMFQGLSADIESSIWKDQERHLNNRNIDAELKKNEKPKDNKKDKDTITYYNISSIGSDEVGTGDYFGPVVVTASFVPKDKESFVKELGVKDSKQLTDDKIIEIAKELIKNIDTKTFILSPSDYNKYTAMGYNMNKIKAILHNKVLYLLKQEHLNDYDRIIVDQFVYKEKYFEHIKEATNKVMDITFTPRAESKCVSVACSSIISRYVFLNEMNKLSKEIGIELPKGAGDIVDDIGIKVAKQYGVEKLESIAKLNFKNTEKIKNKLD